MTEQQQGGLFPTAAAGVAVICCSFSRMCLVVLTLSALFAATPAMFSLFISRREEWGGHCSWARITVVPVRMWCPLQAHMAVGSYSEMNAVLWRCMLVL